MSVKTTTAPKITSSPDASKTPDVLLPYATTISNRKLIAWMFSFLSPVKMLCVLACLYLSLWIGTEILTSRQTGQAVDCIKDLREASLGAVGLWTWIRGPAVEARNLRAVLFSVALLTVAMAILRYLKEVSAAKLSMTLVYYIREAIYDKLQHVGFGFHDTITTGQLINRALTDLQNVRMFLQTAVLVTLEIVLVVGGYELLLISRNGVVAALALAPLPIWIWYILRFGKRVQPASQFVMQADDKNVNLITETIAGVHVIKAFATEKQEIARYRKHADLFIDRVLKRIRLFANFTPVIRGIATLSHLSLFLAAGILIIRRQMQIGDFLILGQAMASILTRLQQVSVINDQYQSAIVSSRRLYEVLAAPATVPEDPAAIALPDGPGSIVFENVTFGYDSSTPVLNDITFRINGGSVVAVVGPTGAGKSTLVSLISRFYDPQHGRILIDGVDLKKIQLQSLRRQVAVVFQETYLFSDTVAANIAYGRPQIEGGQVEAASRLAQAHEFIESLPRGYQTVLAERGASLSGGQRQRLAIARAILTNPRILVLDDATAAVDPETEDLIRRGMRCVMSDRTTFLIAHRISTVKRADVVIVMEHGRITQIGTHQQLMAQDGHYRMIAHAQLYGEDMDLSSQREQPSHIARMRDEREVSAAAAAAAAEPPPLRSEEDV